MTDVWMVMMGIGEMVRNNKPTRIFPDRRSACLWVRECFEEQIKLLDEYSSGPQGTSYGMNIGNSFSIERIKLERGDDDAHSG